MRPLHPRLRTPRGSFLLELAIFASGFAVLVTSSAVAIERVASAQRALRGRLARGERADRVLRLIREEARRAARVEAAFEEGGSALALRRADLSRVELSLVGGTLVRATQAADGTVRREVIAPRVSRLSFRTEPGGLLSVALAVGGPDGGGSPLTMETVCRLGPPGGAP
ncbi:MAG: hypothetical protein L0216_07455 [Planctomycetales bacterium]|nr:hypothetical protein [Planctomycetales bacterium]